RRRVPTVLITGASTGIGRATALRLSRAGWKVLAGVRSGQVGEELAAQAPGGPIEPLRLDVTSEEQIAAARASVDAGGSGRLDALVNNAGVGAGGPMETLTTEELRAQFEVNVFGPMALTRELLPALRRAQGRIVFVSSIGGKVVLPYTAPYGASKHAIEAIADSLRVELAGSKIQVALIEPGSVSTPIWDKSRDEASRLQIPPELEPVYGEVVEKMGRVLEETAKRGVAPDVVAAVIERALGARRMKARYLVGRDARMMLTMRRVLPDLWFDRMVRRGTGL
ncbi:MAG TPA: SDR family oxidoreductase, partial [Solirubrobacteraceae bacterium]|nr:SDR family oxidoreductase [Solirubrobacteraceae bacterium]